MTFMFFILDIFIYYTYNMGIYVYQNMLIHTAINVAIYYGWYINNMNIFLNMFKLN